MSHTATTVAERVELLDRGDPAVWALEPPPTPGR